MKRPKLLLTTAALAALPTAPAFAQGDGFVQVPQEVLDTVAYLLPEYSNAGAAYVSEAYSPNLVISEPATVDLIFIWEGAGYRNTLGWFCYEEHNDGVVSITDSNLIWENVSFPSAGTMQTGQTKTLLAADGTPRVFQPGERVGFFVVANGYGRADEVINWDPYNPTLPYLTPEENADVSQGKGCYTSLEFLNPEYSSGDTRLSRHLAMIRLSGVPGFLDGEDFILSGFEDLNRVKGSDDDFNDLVFIVDASPIEAIEDTDVFVYEEGDPDGDGVIGIDDHYPNDPTRAFVERIPTHGYNVIGFEDLYPSVGDADYNDVGLAYAYELVTNAQGEVKDVQGDFHLITRGAGLDHCLGLHFPDLPSDTTGTLEIERFLSNNAGTMERESRSVQDMIADQFRISDIFPSTQRALPPVSSAFTNTTSPMVERMAASARLVMSFDQAVPYGSLGVAPYDLWFGIPTDFGPIDVHFPGYEGFSDRPSQFPAESGENSFIDDQGFPWLIEIPTNWEVPLERVRIESAYPNFDPWRESRGLTHADWYMQPGDPALRALKLADYLQVRNWAIGLPRPE